MPVLNRRPFRVRLDDHHISRTSAERLSKFARILIGQNHWIARPAEQRIRYAAVVCSSLATANFSTISRDQAVASKNYAAGKGSVRSDKYGVTKHDDKSSK
jgi:hypothetical protein